ncbi:MAG: phosphoribosylformylglycinamidine synthase subunit PurL [Anaerolineales bacterium]|nr:phosphoribosylformylglycinamidine synthase subunit PurL [Anaerolineales bacterium]
MIYRVEVSTKPGLPDARGERLLGNISGVDSLAVTDLYFFKGGLDETDVMRLVHTLLYDPVVEQVRWFALDDSRAAPDQPAGGWSVEVTLLPGVTDSVAESLLAAAEVIGVAGLEQVATGQRYDLTGELSEETLRRIAASLLANEVIQTWTINGRALPPFVVQAGSSGGLWVETIPLTGVSSDQLLAISLERRLSLDLAEMQAIQNYYRQESREPTDVELETLAQTWSEHCVHKTFRALIDYREIDADGNVHEQQIDSLLKTYIRAATERANKPWVRSAFVDNAGIVAFDDDYDLAFKVETHNHPSALEPFGGANTGVGGVVRDVIGVSARPIANTDILCFGPQDLPPDQLPDGVLHPRRIQGGVVAGIEDYGNKMGIPTVNGAILYDPGYTANPLVFCGCLGILPHGSHRTEPQAGDLVVVMGGRTGRDGLRGATFSSMEMDHQTGEIASSSVQIGHPIHEKQTLEAILRARDEGIYSAITDCGAGGLSSAVGEMGATLGAEVHLERAPLKYPGLRPWEIWLSEAQERMVLAVPSANWPRLQAICAGLDVTATALGTFTGDGRLTIRHEGELVGALDCHFLHDGIPRRRLQAEWRASVGTWGVGRGVWGAEAGLDLTEALLALLAAPETRSKEDVVRQYDHEVQGGTVVKPFTGTRNQGPGDAAVIVPLDARLTSAASTSDQFSNSQIHHSFLPTRGVALSVGVNPFYSDLDPYCMAWAAVDEAIRNVVAVGGDPDQVSLLDNFAWGNPNLPDRLGSLVRCAQGCYDAAVAFGAPFVSGKDSLNNEYTGVDGQKHAIPGTLVVSALSIVPDVSRTVTMDLKQAGNLVYAVGLTRGEMGGSSLTRNYPHPNSLPKGEGVAGMPPLPLGEGWGEGAPSVDALALYRALHRASGAGLVRACHDCSEGGLAVAAAEMALAGGLGVELRLADVPQVDGLNDTAVAFCESLGRFLVEVKPGDAAALRESLNGFAAAPVGRVRNDDRILFHGLDGQPVIDTRASAVETAWRGR